MNDTINGTIDHVAIRIEQDWQLLKHIHKYFIFPFFLTRFLQCHWSLNSCGWNGIGREHWGFERWILSSRSADSTRFASYQYRFVDDILFNGFSGHELRVTIINDLFYHFINQNEVLSNTLFTKNTTIVSEYLHHSVQQIKHEGWTHIEFSSTNKVHSKFLCVEEVYTFNIKDRRSISLPEFSFPKEDLICAFGKVLSKVSYDDGVSSSW